MKLSKQTLSSIHSAKVKIPEPKLFELPEKVLQFGTGVFIRSFCDYYIDNANKKGIFNGRIVVVKSTHNGDSASFDDQDGMYTLCSRGIENGTLQENIEINASISRVVNANTQWTDILACARSADMQIILSNTTEVGIQFVEEDIRQSPPKSFPGKLLAFLLERYHHFKASPESGMVIIPAELIPDNATKLKQILLDLSRHNKLEDAFIDWLTNCNSFCNSLVDRIVPGKPSHEEIISLQNELGYEDELLCTSEVFSLWAIEGNDQLKQVLSFSQANPDIVIDTNIEIYRELKLRLLNGTHTLHCGLAFLAGFDLTRDATFNKEFGAFMREMMETEIAASIPCQIETSQKMTYIHQVLERFLNPFIDHKWISITAQYSSKMKMRVLPLIKQYYKQFNTAPSSMSLGFAAFILFMKSVKKQEDKYLGVSQDQTYVITDDMASVFHDAWSIGEPEKVVQAVLSNTSIWGENLLDLPGFYNAVTLHLKNIMQSGVMQAITPLVESISTQGN